MIDAAFWILVVVTGVWAAYSGNFQATTLWAGIHLARESGVSRDIAPTGFQDAITPRFQGTFLNFMFALWICLFVVGWLKAWYFAFIGVVLSSFVMRITERYIPRYVDYYLAHILQDMHNRYADYVRDQDLMRAEAAMEMSECLASLLAKITGEKMQVPTIQSLRDA